MLHYIVPFRLSQCLMLYKGSERSRIEARIWPVQNTFCYFKATGHLPRFNFFGGITMRLLCCDLSMWCDHLKIVCKFTPRYGWWRTSSRFNSLKPLRSAEFIMIGFFSLTYTTSKKKKKKKNGRWTIMTMEGNIHEDDMSWF